MTQAIQKEIDEEKDRLSRIAALVDVMPPHQIKRLDEVKHKAELALARCYGHRLHPDIVTRIVEGMVLDPEVLCSIGGGVNELPMTPQRWDARMKAAVDHEPLAKACIDSRDAVLKETFRNEELAKLKGPEKIAMSRAGTLDDYIEELVKRRIESLNT